MMSGPFMPIAELSTYRTKWTIKGRVTNKGPLRTFNKQGSATQGKVFHVELLDAEGGEIRASFFNDAADRLFNVLEPGKCFTLSKGQIRVANKQYNPTSHRYELIFDREAMIEPATDDASISAIKFNFTNLKAVASRTLPCSIDICGVIASFTATASRTGKDGQELTKREIQVADDSGTSISVTLWGDRAKQEDKNFEGQPTVAIKGVLVKEWQGGRQGSLLQSGTLQFKPAMPEAQRMQQWWSQGGSAQSFADLSQTTGGGGESARSRNAKPMTIAGMRDAAERLLDQVEIYNVVCRLALVQMRKQGEIQPLQYLACQEPKEGNGLPCNRRVDASGFCATCNRAGKTAPRLTVRCRFVDCEDQAWLTTFHEPAQRILDMTGDEVRALELLEDEGGREKLEASIRQRYFATPFTVTVRAKMDSYNGEPRTNITAIEARPVSRGEHGRTMLKEIQEMLKL
mmetsp:Transcript_68583/g.125068  ORF Transcript_68583/g.125068 Transcript_68583/m.125068 type:complete len:459 (+) Transcript_68583:95-1471(+)